MSAIRSGLDGAEETRTSFTREKSSSSIRSLRRKSIAIIVGTAVIISTPCPAMARAKASTSKVGSRITVPPLPSVAWEDASPFW